MSEQTIHTTPSYGHYLAIWVWLVILLALGAYLPSLHLPALQSAGLILSVSLIKALLVGLFYMHLKYEKVAPIWIIVIFPFLLILLSALLVLGGPALV